MVRIQNDKDRLQDDHAAFAKRLKFAAENAGGYSELARRAGVGRSTLFYYLKEGDPTREVLRKLAAAADVDFGWLGTGNGTAFGNSLKDGVLIPVIAAKDGEPKAPVPYLTKRFFGQLSREILANTLTVSSPEALVAYRIQDQYMEGTVSAGEWVIADTGSTELQDGVYCISIGSGIVVRHVTFQGDAGFVVRNEREHKEQQGGFPARTPPRKKDPIRIVGRVVFAQRNLGYR